MKKVKQIAAIIGIIFLVSLYIITFISAFFTTKYTNGLFLASLFSTFVIPVMIYGYMLIYKLLSKRNLPMNPEDTNDQSNSEANLK
ncbi:MAG: hypothetical protein PHF63_06600 [Herbinix sp.]|nr:hypothetical protein [Herbinix sp.]